ncbi:hypothetical protein SCATT_p06430 (plasmid) [Streptantibioticus cattleyicolor NRRL 8057 = DSM 46488]|uniref:Uncharacterized protein n=1 Tax=Streptantibioticus cattleyicolor (strain ATCC 35852 / DSM 46488 / JCM 4925 / NBRC 14057 / NRRL 8057) TaxID=1003195 RepID=G8XH90_STREN|nr:hypothetical protein SCATT_p06430 [Streptantibioticus cattleyicolor NRRL 8057 = DSM 46488]
MRVGAHRGVTSVCRRSDYATSCTTCPGNGGDGCVTGGGRRCRPCATPMYSPGTGSPPR